MTINKNAIVGIVDLFKMIFKFVKYNTIVELYLNKTPLIYYVFE